MTATEKVSDVALNQTGRNDTLRYSAEILVVIILSCMSIISCFKVAWYIKYHNAIADNSDHTIYTVILEEWQANMIAKYRAKQFSNNKI